MTHEQALTQEYRARLAVTASEPALAPRAEALAAELGLPFTTAASDADMLLVLTPERLELRELGDRAAGPVYADFLAGAVDHRRRFGGGKGQPLARAVGIKGGTRPSVLDATAGLGRDAFVLATLGCRVRLVERSTVVAALLADGLARAKEEPEVGPIIERMQLHVGDAAELMAGPPEPPRPEVVYLDPMYPQAGKSALKKKEMRLFRDLVGEDEDAPRLLAAALACASQRVVVKRPRSAPVIEGRLPNMALTSKNTRFDLYLV